MAIARFEQITVKNLAFAKTDFGEQTTAQTDWFKTRARVHSVPFIPPLLGRFCKQ